MIVSDTFSTKSVRFRPFRIRRSREKLFSVDHGIGNVTSSRQHCRPCFFVTVFDGAGVQQYMRHVVLESDAKDLATHHKGVEESRDSCTGFGDVEQPVLSSDREKPACVLRTLVAACGKRMLEESNQGVPPFQRILERSPEFADCLVHIGKAESMDLLKYRTENLSSSPEEDILRKSSIPEAVKQKSFLMEERSVELQQLEGNATLSVSVGLNGFPSCMNEAADVCEGTLLLGIFMPGRQHLFTTAKFSPISTKLSLEACSGGNFEIRSFPARATSEYLESPSQLRIAIGGMLKRFARLVSPKPERTTVTALRRNSFV